MPFHVQIILLGLNVQPQIELWVAHKRLKEQVLPVAAQIFNLVLELVCGVGEERLERDDSASYDKSCRVAGAISFDYCFRSLAIRVNLGDLH